MAVPNGLGQLIQRWSAPNRRSISKGLATCSFIDVYKRQQRFTPGASAKTFLENGLQAVKGLGSQLLEPPRALLKDLQPGHGGIVEWGEEKVGAYRDEAGEVFLVSTRCPHLGCCLLYTSRCV